MLRRVSLSDWTVYIASELLIIYIACDSVYAVCVCVRAGACGLRAPLCLLLSLHHYSALSQPRFCRFVIIQTVPGELVNARLVPFIPVM